MHLSFTSSDQFCYFGWKFICHLAEAGKLFRLSRLYDMLSSPKTMEKITIQGKSTHSKSTKTINHICSYVCIHRIIHFCYFAYCWSYAVHENIIISKPWNLCTFELHATSTDRLINCSSFQVENVTLNGLEHPKWFTKPMNANLSDRLFLNIVANCIHLDVVMFYTNVPLHPTKNVAMLSSCLHNKHKHVGPCLTSTVNHSDCSVKNVHKECA